MQAGRELYLEQVPSRHKQAGSFQPVRGPGKEARVAAVDADSRRYRVDPVKSHPGLAGFPGPLEFLA